MGKEMLGVLWRARSWRPRPPVRLDKHPRGASAPLRRAAVARTPETVDIRQLVPDAFPSPARPCQLLKRAAPAGTWAATAAAADAGCSSVRPGLARRDGAV
jgi:hypothetical protein